MDGVDDEIGEQAGAGSRGPAPQSFRGGTEEGDGGKVESRKQKAGMGPRDHGTTDDGAEGDGGKVESRKQKVETVQGQQLSLELMQVTGDEQVEIGHGLASKKRTQKL
jgi:hypothetical protein